MLLTSNSISRSLCFNFVHYVRKSNSFLPYGSQEYQAIRIKTIDVITFCQLLLILLILNLPKNLQPYSASRSVAQPYSRATKQSALMDRIRWPDDGLLYTRCYYLGLDGLTLDTDRRHVIASITTVERHRCVVNHGSTHGVWSSLCLAVRCTVPS